MRSSKLHVEADRLGKSRERIEPVDDLFRAALLDISRQRDQRRASINSAFRDISVNVLCLFEKFDQIIDVRGSERLRDRMRNDSARYCKVVELSKPCRPGVNR